jgi:hypothetical protein
MFKKQFVRAVRVLLRGRGLEHSRLVFEFFFANPLMGSLQKIFDLFSLINAAWNLESLSILFLNLVLAFVNI